ncbi:MAG: tRNA-dihydrouridine synthase family protein [Clostridia bacterium]|nr:tRNA-dihydrouridine synthase family protein [Clostridia bacterium]
MKILFAPLEGITNFVYRNTHNEMFGHCDEYYSPFITPSEDDKVNRKGLNDIIPENNPNITIKPQVLTNSAEAFLKFTEKIQNVGYDEVNLNFGCPSQTVVKKGKGSGFLKEPDRVDSFLEDVFEIRPMKISVKTRTGFLDGGEMENLTEIYNKYPIELLIIHPRTRSDFYNGMPDLEVFKKAFYNSKNPVCYNGNVDTAEDYKRIKNMFPSLDCMMLGRGLIRNPALAREIRGGQRIRTEEIIAFSKRLADNYQETLRSETFTLNKLKEVWMYMIQNYPEEKKIFKTIRKAGKLVEFMGAIEALPELK